MFKQQVQKKIVNLVLSFALAFSFINLSAHPASTIHASTPDTNTLNSSVMEAVYFPAETGSVNLLDPSRFTPQAGMNLKVSSEAADHPGVDALRSGGSGYWRNSSSNVYKSNYSPSSLALTLDLGVPKTIDKLYLEIPNTIANIQSNATRFEVYYTNDSNSWASAPTASDTANNYNWKANGWTLAGGTETEGLWSYVTYNGQQWGYDTKTFLYPFTARYVMINTLLVGPSDKRANDTSSTMGISGLAIYGKDSVSNTTALVPAKDTYSTWDQVAPKSTIISLTSGQTLTCITRGDTTLRPNIDYSLTGSTVTFSLPYLAKLPLGTNEFNFHFNSGNPSIFELDVIARGYGANDKTIKMNAIEGVSPYNILGGAMGTDEPVEGVTKRIRDAYHEFYGDQPKTTAADDHIKSIWDSTLQKNVFKVIANGRGLNNEFLDKVRDGEYGHKGIFDRNLGYVVDGAAITDRQRIEIRPSEDSNGDFVAYEGDLVSYEWLWNIPDGNQWNQSNFRHIFQLKAVNRQAPDTLPGGNNGGENGAYIMAMSISGTNSRDLVVNHNRYDGDKTLMRIPLKEIDGHWIKVELNALISDSGWFTIKITDRVTGKVYTYDSPDVYQVFTNKGASDGTKDIWRRPERVGGFETEYPAAFDQYLRPKWGIYRSSANGTNSAYDASLQLADITIRKVASGLSSVNIALNKKAYNLSRAAGANPIQMQSAMANEYGNANKLTNGVLEDPTKWNVTNVTSLNQIGNYSWLGTDGERKGSFVIDLGQAMDFSQLRLFAKSNRLKGATVYVSDDFGNHTSAVEFDAMTFKQVDRQTAQGYTYATGNNNGGTDSEDGSYPINLGKTYHSRYIKVMVENASGGNSGTDLTGPPRLTQVQVFNAPTPPQNLTIEANELAKNLKWDTNDLSEGYAIYNGAIVLADLPVTATSYTLPSSITDVSKVAVRSKGTDPNSRKLMISAPTLVVDPQDVTPPKTEVRIEPSLRNGWLNKDGSVALTALDDLSAVVKTEYEVGDNTEWQTYAGSIAFKNEGVYRLQFRSVDAAGNIEQTKELSVQIDKTKPVFVLTANGEPLAESAVFSDDRSIALLLNANDALSGLESQELALDGKRLENGASVDLTGNLGLHTLKIVITDLAGNKTDETVSFTIAATPEGLSNLIDRYAKAGELKGPLINQLRNSLDQALYQLGKGDKDKALKHMQDFLKHLNNMSMTDNVSETVKSILTADAKALIEIWSAK
ncbi:hypothetical protein QFZ81_002846 [Paenibacillus sp. V4I9]|uniref:FIMAH domain-containing protein n=1 Tax=Paenibacillus sp. V4I9 TaxID=3042308 RepID=UPI00277D78CF|nr:X2-like carbohydrate binding domain-containing protein [Paenibacillus sp. V4I9]MDQ0887758.1 hypothetical protein [Paenibacillus sp. V4I9]